MSGQNSTCHQQDNVRTCLTTSSSIGLSFVAEAGLVSLTALFILLILLIRNVVRYVSNPPSHRWSLIQVPADAYVLSLFFADALQSTGAAMDVRWVQLGHVQIGGYCTAQGTIQQLGETAVAFATMVIAIHTFVSVWFRRGALNMKVAWIVIAGTWTFVALFVGIAAGVNKNYYNPTPYWCWVGANFGKDRIAGEYFWLWLTLAVSILVYVPLFMWNQGNISVDERYWWKVKFHWRQKSPLSEDDEARIRPSDSSLAMLAYPVAYSIVVLPVSVSRFIEFGNSNGVPTAATFACVCLHDLFGAVNVVLLLTTRPNLLLFGGPRLQHSKTGAYHHDRSNSTSRSRSRSSSLHNVLLGPYPPDLEVARTDAMSNKSDLEGTRTKTRDYAEEDGRGITNANILEENRQSESSNSRAM